MLGLARRSGGDENHWKCRPEIVEDREECWFGREKVTIKSRKVERLLACKKEGTGNIKSTTLKGRS